MAQLSAQVLELFSAVYAAPKERARKEVLADALIEQGEPRGEFIALQLDGSTRAKKRSAKLLERHRASFLGPLAPAMVSRAEEWREGFLVAAQVRLRGTLVDEPSWATLERLVLVLEPPPPLELASVHLRSLTRLELTTHHGGPLSEARAREFGALETWEAQLQALERVRALLVEGHRPGVLRQGREWHGRWWGRED